MRRYAMLRSFFVRSPVGTYSIENKQIQVFNFDFFYSLLVEYAAISKIFFAKIFQIAEGGHLSRLLEADYFGFGFSDDVVDGIRLLQVVNYFAKRC